MNNTSDSGEAMSSDSDGFLGSSNLGGFGYGIGLSVGVLLLITTITLVSYFCTRTAPISQTGLEPSPPCVVDVGLNEATIKSYPKLQYYEAKIQKSGTTASCCSICLADYKSTDMLRLLPECGHLFHLKCVDPWLRLRTTCPVCRTSPIPTAFATSLAETVPLATRRDS